MKLIITPDAHEIELAHQRGIISDAELQILVITLERERAKHDLYYLAGSILGYDDLTPAHRDLCAVVQSINPLIQAQRHKYLPSKDLGGASSQPKTACGGGGEGGSSWVTHPQNSIKIPELSHCSTNISRVPLISEIRFAEPKLSSALKQYVEFDEAARTRLFLMFRGSFKSTIVTIAHTIQLMLIWPDIRILIASHKKEGGSQKFLQSIKDHFIRNERFRRLFPEYCPRPNAAGLIEWGTSEAVTLPNRSSTAIFPESTLEIAGATTDVTGRHYNVLKVDDLVTRESVTNEQMLARTEEFNALLKFLFDQPEWGLMDYSGTSYHFADIYQTLRKSKITKVIMPIWDDNENITIPERFTHNGVEAIKNDSSMTSYQFSAQYLLNPIPKEDQKFRPEYFEREGFYYTELPERLKVYVLVDPASTQRKESDFTALITIGMDDSGDLWLIDIIRDKLSQDERAELVYRTLVKHGIHTVHYESISFQASDHKPIKDKGYSNGWYISVEEIKASAQSKDDRIAGLQYFYENGKVHWPRKYMYYSKYFRREIDMVEVLRLELLMFPSTQFKDLSDCHSFILRTGMLKASTIRSSKQDDLFDRLRQHAIDSKKPKQEFHGFGNKLNQRGRGIPAKKAFF